MIGVVLAVLLAWALFFGGGSDAGRLAWIGGAAVVAAAAAVALLPRPRLTRAARWFLALLALYAVWVGVSLTWSWAPDAAWDAFNRDVVYLAFAVLGLYAGAARVATLLTVLVPLVAVWALVSHVFPDDDAERTGRLADPVGYWNVLAFVLALGLPLALRLRVETAAAIVYVLSVALLLTYSRGGVLAGVVAVTAWVVLARPSLLDTAARLAAGVAPAAVVFALADRGDGEGAALALLLVAGAVGTVLLVLYVPPRALAATGAGVVAAAAVAFVVVVGNPITWTGDKLDAFTNPPTVQRAPDELLTATSSNRWTWWGEALDAWRDEPAVGTGAGSFELVHRRLRDNDLHARDPHSLPIAALSETGVVGLALLVAAVACAVAAGRRRVDAALAAGAIAYLVHSLVDMHWEYVAATAPVMAVAGALAGASDSELQTRGRRRGFGIAAAALVALALLYSIAAPALADSRAARAQERIAAKDFDGAIEAADDAHSLNPLAVEPLFALGLAEDLRADKERALGHYEDAVALQPENWRTWYELGVFEYLSLRDLDAAFLDLDKAYSLDPRNVAIQRWLDRVRDELNRGGG